MESLDRTESQQIGVADGWHKKTPANRYEEKSAWGSWGLLLRHIDLGQCGINNDGAFLANSRMHEWYISSMLMRLMYHRKKIW